MTTVVQDQFSAGFSRAFEPPAGPQNEFSAAFAGAFDPVATGAPTALVLTGTRLFAVGNFTDTPPPVYLLHVVEPDGTSMALNTITRATRTRIECTWTFTQPGTHYLVVVAASDDAEVTDRLPVVVTT